jgi:hypothetical protein
MAQFIIYKNKNKKRGVTLIELVLYIGLFVILVSGVLYSAIYLQSVLQYNTLEYTAEEQIYRQLGLLQQHMQSATKVETGSSSIRIYGKYGYIEQYLHGYLLHMKYVYVGKDEKDIILYPFLKLQEFSFIRENRHESLLGNSVVWVEVARRDMRGKVKKLKEWLVGV